MKSRLTSLACLLAFTVNGQTLEQQILAMDKKFFDAFNQCDIQTMANLFSPDLEFYHDQAGIADYAQSMQNTRALCERNLKLKRQLVEGSTRIFPIAQQGAIQHGKHQFCHPEQGKMDCGTFEFIHIWRIEDGKWTLSRVISFAH